MGSGWGVAGQIILLVTAAVLFKKSWRESVSDICARGTGLDSAGIWMPFCLLMALNIAVMWLTDTWSYWSFLERFGYLMIATAVFSVNSRDDSQPNWKAGLFDLLFLLICLYLPIAAQWIHNDEFYLVKGSAVMLALIGYTGARRRDFGLDWHYSKADLKLTIGLFVGLFLILPLGGLAMGFLKIGMSGRISGNPLVDGPKLFVIIWFAIALVEEMVFRGIIQDVFTGWWGPKAGIPVTAVIFGFAHIGQKAGGHHFPNWPYVILATIAGFAYGFVYWKRKAAGSRNALGCAVMLHTLVDFTWNLCFKR